MKRLVPVVLLATMATTMSCPKGLYADKGEVVLPNARLLGCKSAECLQFWQRIPSGGDAVYPRNVAIEIDGSSISGIVALYDKSTPMDDIRATIDKFYGQWAAASNGTTPVKLWRCTPHGFAIQLSTDDTGMQQVVYRAFVTYREGQAP
jgi:hypothetical protein